jgi:hypothetical protein
MVDIPNSNPNVKISDLFIRQTRPIAGSKNTIFCVQQIATDFYNKSIEDTGITKQATTLLITHRALSQSHAMKTTSNNSSSASSSNIENNHNMLRSMSARVRRATTQATATEDSNIETVASVLRRSHRSTVSFHPTTSSGMMIASGAVSSLSQRDARQRRKRLISVIDRALEIIENDGSGSADFEDENLDFLAIQ